MSLGPPDQGLRVRDRPILPPPVPALRPASPPPSPLPATSPPTCQPPPPPDAVVRTLLITSKLRLATREACHSHCAPTTHRSTSARAGGGALPVMMPSIRSSRKPRLPQLQPLSARYTHQNKRKSTGETGKKKKDGVMACQRAQSAELNPPSGNTPFAGVCLLPPALGTSAVDSFLSPRPIKIINQLIKNSL